MHVLHPADSGMDRLVTFIHWNARSGLSQALAKANPGEIGLTSIEAWADGENGRAKFAEFRERFNRRWRIPEVRVYSTRWDLTSAIAIEMYVPASSSRLPRLKGPILKG